MVQEQQDLEEISLELNSISWGLKHFLLKLIFLLDITVWISLKGTRYKDNLSYNKD